MPATIAMLRGVNVGGNHKVPMQKLREICEQMGLQNPETFIQSGNVVFDLPRKVAALANQLENALEHEFGFRAAVVLRTVAEMRAVVSGNPFPGRDGAKLLVTFLQCDPGDAARESARTIAIGPEDLHLEGREMFVYYPAGAGQSKLPMAKLERALGCMGTSRNWNTVQKLLAMAERR